MPAPQYPGARDHLVTIQQLVSSTGPSGLPIEEWVPLGDVWMSKSDLTGTERERFVMNQETAPFETTWVMPYRADMDPDEVEVPRTRRLIYKARQFDVIDAAMVGRRESVQLLTRARMG